MSISMHKHELETVQRFSLSVLIFGTVSLILFAAICAGCHPKRDAKAASSITFTTSSLATPIDEVADGKYFTDASGMLRERSSGHILPLPLDLTAALAAKISTGSAGPHPSMKTDTGRIDRNAYADPGKLTPRALLPDGYNVQSDMPVLSWKGTRGLDSFIVRVMDENGNTVWKAVTVRGRCRVGIALKRGAVYRWQVAGAMMGSIFYSKTAQFRVLSTRDAESVADRLKQAKGSHLARGSILEKYGLYDKALAEFKALQKSNPESSTVRNMLQHLKKDIAAVGKAGS